MLVDQKYRQEPGAALPAGPMPTYLMTLSLRRSQSFTPSSAAEARWYLRVVQSHSRAARTARSGPAATYPFSLNAKQRMGRVCSVKTATFFCCFTSQILMTDFSVPARK